MVDIYSSVGVINEAKAITQRPGDIAIRIALQTIECGIFILHYTSGAGKLFIISSASNLFISDQITSIRPANNWGHEENTIAPLKGIWAAQGGA